MIFSLKKFVTLQGLNVWEPAMRPVTDFYR